ncbi:ABC transporter substrate-binding protein [Phyllobacterium leguminum]|uniref:Peptide/nickel transport system substrate-binding protein n=1 Tax=Phyllobacterium leguminum TaxID=314237 RepID=A0A318TA06_9HYPH|nr:ABC transporter substrate-binding protein [Phyllobacterium leguminum]PYE90494.1 peptide/nickel transport system substrate-binding protein [Phyllobacterium leguminum]
MKNALFLMTLAAMAGTSSLAIAQAKTDGVLTVATIGEPPTLDAMQTPTDIVLMIDQHIFETLFTYDIKWKSVPLLAASQPTISEDGLTYRIPLREGVKFHDGSDFDAKDVVASLTRWMAVNSKGKQVAGVVDSIAEDGDHAVTIKLKSRYAPLLATLSQASIILPSEKIADTLTEFVGTGPYALKERKPDQYTQLVRFEDYKSPDGEPSNYAGKREAIAKEIRFVPVPDANTRVEGLISGQFDFADSLPVSAFERVEASGKAKPVIYENAGWASLNMNMKEGLLTKKALRQAVQSALNPSDMMLAAFSDKRFFSVDGSIFPKGSFWHTEAGVVRYGEGDPETAAKLIAEAGYDGTPIRLMTSRQYEFHYKIGEVAKAYLEAAGFKVDLQVVDWATLTTRRADPKQWDIFITHSNFPGDPTTINTITDTYPGWYVSDQKAKAVAAYMDATSDEAKFKAWEGIQTVIYDDAPLFKAGNFNALTGVATGVSGYMPTYWPHFWNVTPK